jgi:microcystin-dependent protein
LENRPIGSKGGAANIALSMGHMPPHNHQAMAATVAANNTSPSGGIWALGGETRGGIPLYAPLGAAVAMNENALSEVGGGELHNNLPPYLGLHYIICTGGRHPDN